MNDTIRRVYGIDLGTTYSSIAYVDEYGKPVIIPNAENQRVTPSVVFFDGGDIVVGDVAKESSKLYPNDVASFIKRSMGEPDFIFDLNSKAYRAEEISSFIIRKVAQDAEQNLGEKITDLVITCPAYFGINEREATKRAGEIAGYNVRQILNEPTAAAIAYGAMETEESRVVLVYDLGGGTFDITMIAIQADAIEVICTGGDHNLGGKDWDDRIVAAMVEEFQAQTGTNEDILEDPDTCQDLQLLAEKSKKVLTQRLKTPISITHGGERIKMILERKRFEEITADLLERTVTFSHQMLEEARKKGYEKFDEIILVGGSTRMPQVEARLEKEFNLKPKVFDPDEAIAKGAAIYGWKLAMNDGMVKRIAEKTHNSEEHVAEVIQTAPKHVLNEMANKFASETGISLPSLQRSMIRITDVTSKSFGVVVLTPNKKERVFNLILKNTAVPTHAKRTFYTAVPNQKSVLIRIMESETGDESVDTEKAIEIGTATLNLPEGLPPDLPIEITFLLNEEGRLQISALETHGDRRVEVDIATTSVIDGEDFELAKTRSQSLVVY